jgi:uncharacterized membrane protein
MGLSIWLHFIHFIGVVLYVGGDIVLNVLAWQTSKDRNPEGFLQIVKAATPVIGGGAVLTLISGLWMIGQNEIWQFSMGWVLAGIAMIIIAGVAESIYFGLQLQMIRSELIEKGPQSPRIAVCMSNIVKVGAIINVLFIVVIWLMVFKP